LCFTAEKEPWGTFVKGQTVKVTGKFPDFPVVPELEDCAVEAVTEANLRSVTAEALAKECEADPVAAGKKMEKPTLTGTGTGVGGGPGGQAGLTKVGAGGGRKRGGGRPAPPGGEGRGRGAGGGGGGGGGGPFRFPLGGRGPRHRPGGGAQKKEPAEPAGRAGA